MKYVVLILAGLLLVAQQAASADSIQVSTSKQTYHYGDYLSITITIPNITSDTAVMYIIDADQKKSSPIPIRITDKTTTIDAPNSFDPTIFKEGKYNIEVDYNGAKSFAEFELVDIGNVVLPFGSTAIVSQWADDKISDYIFLKFLADNKLILFSVDQPLKESVKIPSWYKTNAEWWSEKQITDEEFVNGLQYLLDKKIISA